MLSGGGATLGITLYSVYSIFFALSEHCASRSVGLGDASCHWLMEERTGDWWSVIGRWLLNVECWYDPGSDAAGDIIEMPRDLFVWYRSSSWYCARRVNWPEPECIPSGSSMKAKSRTGEKFHLSRSSFTRSLFLTREQRCAENARFRWREANFGSWGRSRYDNFFWSAL